MAAVRLNLVVCLISCAIWFDHSHLETHGLPLENCHQDPIDLFFIVNPFLDPIDCFLQLESFTEIAKAFLSPNDVQNSRVRVAIGYGGDDSHNPDGVSMFRAYNHANKLNVDSDLKLISVENDNDHYHDFEKFKSNLDESVLSERGARSSSDAVLVLIFIYDEIFSKYYLDIYLDDSKFKLFFFSINQKVDSVAGYLVANNTMVLRDIYSLFSSNHLQMFLCKQCSQGWVPFYHTKGEYIMSCYKLDSAPTKIGWLDALSRGGKFASLACIELEEELKYLQGKVWSLLAEKENELQEGDVSKNGDVKIYIGLNRNVETTDKRFRWTLRLDTRKQHFPLTITNWMPGNPDGGHAQGCGAWVFYRFNESKSVPVPKTLQDSENQNGYGTFQKREGWMDIGCGNPLTRFSLFEAVLPRVPVASPAFSQTRQVSLERIETVSKWKEFVEYEGKLVSVASYLKDDEFRFFLQNKSEHFPAFNCGESDGQNMLVSYSEVCDSVDHCPNRRDEYVCHYRTCGHLEFRCNSGHCIERDGRCDNFVDCPDGSDEEDCAECRGYRCCDGSCLPQHWVGDGEVDCYCYDEFDGSALSDELPSPIKNESIDGQFNDVCVFVCNRSNCVYHHQLADGVTDCAGPEGPLDETLGKLQISDSCFDELGRSLWAPRCVYVKDRYGSVLGCRDMSHLLRCENFECQEGYSKCPNSYCIPLHFIQDGIGDCPMGEDEQNILDLTDRDCSGNFLCWGSKVCLHPELLCDGRPHCPNSDDELNCHIMCRKGFNCIAGTITVSDFNKSIPLLDFNELDGQARHIDLSGINISAALDDFSHFTNLVEVIFSNCSLKDVSKIFANPSQKNYETVYTMDLSYNLIEYIDGDKFLLWKNLHVLILSHNYKLASINDRYAYGHGVLEVLDLSYTSIATLQEATFSSLINLRTLNLSHTLITDINRVQFPANFRLQKLDLRLTPITNFGENSFNGLMIESDLHTDHSGLCCPQVRGSCIPAHTCHAPTDAISSCYNLIGSGTQRVLLWLMAVVALVGNVTVVMYRLVWGRSILKMAYGWFVTNLAASDLVMGFYLLIIACADIHYRNVYVWKDGTWRQSLACKVSGFLATFSSETSVFFIFLVTLDRYFVIKYPYGQIRFSKIGKIVAVIVAWSAGFILALVPTLSVFDGENTIFSSNPVCLGMSLTLKNPTGWGYSFSVFIVLNFVMFLIIAFGQLAIFNAMSSNRVEKEASSHMAFRRSQDIQVAKQLSMVALSDFLCWFPVGLMGLLTLGGTEISPDAYAWTSVLVLPVNAALNPVLYTVPVIMAKWEKFKHGKSNRFRCLLGQRGPSNRGGKTTG